MPPFAGGMPPPVHPLTRGSSFASNPLFRPLLPMSSPSAFIDDNKAATVLINSNSFHSNNSITDDKNLSPLTWWKNTARGHGQHTKMPAPRLPTLAIQSVIYVQLVRLYWTAPLTDICHLTICSYKCKMFIEKPIKSTKTNNNHCVIEATQVGVTGNNA